MVSLLNLDMLREVTDGDAALEQHLFALYSATAERCLGQMKLLTEADGEGKWDKLVHELKGASSNIRAEALESLCRQVEHLPLDPHERQRACELLEECYARTRAHISQLPR